MSDITRYAWTAAKRLMADCQLATFRRDEAARIVQDAMDWANADKAQAAKETEVPQRAPAPAEQMNALQELAEGVGQ